MNLQDTNLPSLPGIYRIKHVDSNKSYIGSAINLKNRLRRHYTDLKKGIHPNSHLQRAFDKYGIDKFKIDVIELFNDIDYKDLINIEKKYIIKEDLLNKGYNQMIDNRSFMTMLNKSKDHIKSNVERCSKAVISFDMNTGKKIKEYSSLTEASFSVKTSTSNISRVCKGSLSYVKGLVFCYSDEYNENKVYRAKHWAKGEKMNKYHKKNLTKANQSRLGKKVYVYDINMNLIDELPSMSSAESKYKLRKECLRYKIDKETPFEGKYWRSTKL